MRKIFLQLSGMLIIAFAAAVTFYQVFAIEGKMAKHASSIIEVKSGSVNDRLVLWENTLEVIREQPIIGHGLANWKIEILKEGNENLSSADNLTFYQRPHNDFLWIVSEAGVIGLVFYLILFLLPFIIGIKRLTGSEDIAESVFLIVLLASLLAFLVFSFFSFPLERIVQNTFFVLIIGGLTSMKFEKKSLVKRGLARILYFIFLCVAVVGVITAYHRFYGEAHLKDALQSKEARAYDQVIEDIKKASGPFYRMDPTSTPLTWYSGFAFYQAEDYNKAIGLLREAKSMNPYHVHILNNLGSSFFQTGLSDSAAFYYQQALSYAPGFVESRFNLCAALHNSGNSDSAYQVLRTIDTNTVDPRYPVFVQSILSAQIRSMFPADSIPNLPDDPEWYLELNKIAIRNNSSLERLIFESELIVPNNLPVYE
jgi:tetratricopeptide (TPR) repeat protein